MDRTIPIPPEEEPASHCQRCGRKGMFVEEVTLKALLRGPALERRADGKHRFCPTPDCPVVYFGVEETFTRKDLTVPVFQKEPPGTRMACNCFEITESEILKEMSRTGQSSLREKITGLVKANRCACELKNPQGFCCLSNVVLVLRSIEKDAGDPGNGKSAQGNPKITPMRKNGSLP